MVFKRKDFGNMKMNAEDKLRGRVALVTGAAGRGIGRATAYALGLAGASVIVNTRRSIAEAENVAAQLRELGNTAVAIQADITDEKEVDMMLDSAANSIGVPDIVVIGPGGSWNPTPLDQVDSDKWEQNIVAETSSMLFICRKLLPTMQINRLGNIVAISGYGANEWNISPDEGPYDYALGKTNRDWLMRQFAKTYAKYGIAINTVAPGPVHRISNEDVLPALHDGIFPDPNMERPNQVDVAEAIVWLCSQRTVTGTIVNLPGPNPGSVI